VTVEMVNAIVGASMVRAQGFRSVRWPQRVGESFGAERTEAACERAMGFSARSYKPAERVLRLGAKR